jgi:hypothetical protein
MPFLYDQIEYSVYYVNINEDYDAEVTPDGFGRKYKGSGTVQDPYSFDYIEAILNELTQPKIFRIFGHRELSAYVDWNVSVLEEGEQYVFDGWDGLTSAGYSDWSLYGNYVYTNTINIFVRFCSDVIADSDEMYCCYFKNALIEISQIWISYPVIDRYFYGCTFSCDVLSMNYVGGQGRLTINSCLFDFQNFSDYLAWDSGEDYTTNGLVNFNNCIFIGKTRNEMESYFSVILSLEPGCIKFNDCYFDVSLQNTLPELSAINSTTLDYNETGLYTYVLDDFVTNEYNFGFDSTARYGAGAFYFTEPTPRGEPHYPIRFKPNKTLTFDKMTPEFIKQSQFIQLVDFFEDYMNSMYDGDGYYSINKE